MAEEGRLGNCNRPPLLGQVKVERDSVKVDMDMDMDVRPDYDQGQGTKFLSSLAWLAWLAQLGATTRRLPSTNNRSS